MIQIDAAPYSNDWLKTLFEGWFENKDEEAKAELLRIIEIEILVEVENQMSFIEPIIIRKPAVSFEAFRIRVERRAIEIAFKRKHRDPNEPPGDALKRLGDYWKDPGKRQAYPDLYKQIRYVVWSIVREAITKSIRDPFIRDEYRLAELWVHIYITEPSEEDEEGLKILLELRNLPEDKGGFSEDEKKYIETFLELANDSYPTDSQIARKLGWPIYKAHRVKKSIANKVKHELERRDTT